MVWHFVSHSVYQKICYGDLNEAITAYSIFWLRYTNQDDLSPSEGKHLFIMHNTTSYSMSTRSFYTEGKVVEVRGYLPQDRQCAYNVTLRRVRSTIVVVEKQWVLHNLSVSIALVIQHAMRMRHIFSVVCPALQYFPTYFIKGTIFVQKLLSTKCVFRFLLQICLKYFSF